MYTVTKTYGHELGLSACFRQHRAKSHCAQLHGYALSITLVFSSTFLNENNWVIDFGGLKPIKTWLVETFDHKLLVAKDDPELDHITGLAGLGLADVVVTDHVGCEAFAELIHAYVTDWLLKTHQRDCRNRDLQLVSVTVREHGANAATYAGEGL